MKPSQIQSLIDAAERMKHLNEFMRDLKALGKELSSSDQRITISFSKSVLHEKSSQDQHFQVFTPMLFGYHSNPKKKNKQKIKTKITPVGALRMIDLMLKLAAEEYNQLIKQTKQQ